MFKTLIEWLFNDIKWKLLALVLAVLLWFVGMTVNNPTETRPFERDLILSNKDSLTRDNVVILNEKQLQGKKINIGVKATRSDLNTLNARTGNIMASIDLRNIDTSWVWQSDNPVTVPVEVDVDILLPGYERVNRIPRSVDVELDKYVQQTKTVLAYAVGEVKEGYELQGVTSLHSTVVVSGAKSLVDKVQTVRTQVNIQDADGDINRVEKLTVYDGDGNDITSTVELSAKETSVHVSVLPYKTVKLEVLVSGTPAQGFKITDVQPDPKAVDIVGTPEALASVTELWLDGINVDYVNENLTKTLDIRLSLAGTGLSLRSGQPSEAEVTVTVERWVVREFSFPVENIRTTGYSSGTSVRLLRDEPVTVAVRGSESDINRLTQDRVSVQLALFGLENGTHSVPLTVILPQGCTLANAAPVIEVLIQSAAEDSTDPEETAPETTTEGETADTSNNAAEDSGEPADTTDNEE